MDRASRTPRGTRLSITAPQATEVHVAGTFNGWNSRAHPLRRGRDGRWSGVVDLDTGSHQYKFVVDGRWCCADGRDEPFDGKPGHVRNEFGTSNMVLQVPPRRSSRNERHPIYRPQSMLANVPAMSLA